MVPMDSHTAEDDENMVISTVGEELALHYSATVSGGSSGLEGLVASQALTSLMISGVGVEPLESSDSERCTNSKRISKNKIAHTKQSMGGGDSGMLCFLLCLASLPLHP